MRVVPGGFAPRGQGPSRPRRWTARDLLVAFAAAPGTVEDMTEQPNPVRAPSISGHDDPDGEAPWALQLAVRAEKTVRLEAAEVYEASARAVVALLAAPQAAPGGAWAPALERWLAGRIRKICRRGCGAAYERVLELDGVTAQVGTATVRAFVPCPTDTVPPALAKLQVQGLEAEPAPAHDPDAVLSAAPSGTLVIALTPAPAMSVGKAAAQVAHAANVAYLNAAPGDRRAWVEAGIPIAICTPEAGPWQRFAAAAPVQIHDAGFTEIPSGTLTAVARFA